MRSLIITCILFSTFAAAKEEAYQSIHSTKPTSTEQQKVTIQTEQSYQLDGTTQRKVAHIYMLPAAIELELQIERLSYFYAYDEAVIEAFKQSKYSETSPKLQDFLDRKKPISIIGSALVKKSDLQISDADRTVVIEKEAKLLMQLPKFKTPEAQLAN